MKVELNESDVKLLKEVQELMRHVGFGEIYGGLGRMTAIVHHQLLNDNPKCYTLDKDGKKRECKLEPCDKQGVIEMSNIIDSLKHMNSRNLTYDRFSKLIEKIEKAEDPEKSKGWFKWLLG